MFEAASRDESVIVHVGRRGDTLRVQLEPAAMQLTDDELANRIVRLNTLAYLRSQLAIRLEMESNKVEGISVRLPTEQQVSAYAATIDF
ncbi:hypothetical protein MFM001_42780 [Mycobacterium sp. MFM001]|uniref:DUF2694 domain-containing protein n=1 Tax=Mycobacterium sp. MFM001 TaxID=2049453 RepID=UPI000DA4B0CE|nr:DUF2694 domain-containing protein [Mycobacterium sp. MFM001]GBE67816.1 hypothetical protein MFM001_42780 [Mycobacterium sp. MFM001]